MRKGQPLKLQPCMLTDSKWMRVFNSIVSNITMIPNSGNRSKFGIDILNKQDRKALASSNEREPVKIRARQLKFYPMKLYTDTKARWRKVSQQFSAILSTSSCTHMRQKQPNFTQSKYSFYKQSLILLTSLWRSVRTGNHSEHTIVLCTISSTWSSHPSHKAFASTKKTKFWFPFRVFFPYRLQQGTIIFLPPHRFKAQKFNPFRHNSSSKSTQNNLRQF